MKQMIVLLCCIVLFGCNQKSEIEKGESPIATEATRNVDAQTEDSGLQCYEFVQEKDTISLQFSQANNRAEGHLKFKNYQKDSSYGAVSGRVSGDTLKLVYVFESEGMQSKRQIFFLKDGLSLRMGTADMEDKDGTLVFKAGSPILYSDAVVLVKSDCR